VKGAVKLVMRLGKGVKARTKEQKFKAGSQSLQAPWHRAVI
jgi:hypothetical protein